MAERLQHPYSWRAWLIAVLVGLLCGVTALSQPIDLVLRGIQFKLHSRPVSGDIVVVGVDDTTLATSGTNGFDRTDTARTIDAIRKAGANRLFVDFVYNRPAPAEDTRMLERAISRWGGNIFMAVLVEDQGGATQSSKLENIGSARQVAIDVIYEASSVWKMPVREENAGVALDSMSSAIAGTYSPDKLYYSPDYGYDYKTIQLIGANTVLKDPKISDALRGKDVILAPTAMSLLDVHFMPGHNVGRLPGAFFHVIGAETLRHGIPSDFGWFPAWILLSALLIAGRFSAVNRLRTVLIMGCPIAAVVTVLAIPVQIAVISVGPALVTGVIIGIAAARRRRQRRTQRHHHEFGTPQFRSAARFKAA